MDGPIREPAAALPQRRRRVLAADAEADLGPQRARRVEPRQDTRGNRRAAGPGKGRGSQRELDIPPTPGAADAGFPAGGSRDAVSEGAGCGAGA